MVYDVFPFFNELDILKLRLNVMNPCVDRFIIEEATHTFSGLPKELVFKENRHLFTEFLPKIEHIVVDDSPADLGPHERDHYQKNRLLDGLGELRDEDIIIFSDVDEIPNPEVIERIIASFDPDLVYHLAQRMFHGYLNMEEVSEIKLSVTGEFPRVEKRKWLGTKVFSKRSIPPEGIVYIRELDICQAPPALLETGGGIKRASGDAFSPEHIRVDNGGWHFSYMGGMGEKDVARRVAEKIVAAAHQEYNHPDTLAEISDKAVLGKDFLGSEAEFAQVDIDESFPAYLRAHISEYEHLLLPQASQGKKALRKAVMLVKRFFRKATRRMKRIFLRR